MKTEKTQVSLTILLTLCLCGLHTGAERCGEELEKPVILDESGASSFPLRKFQKKLRKAKKGVNEWLQNAEENINANLNDDMKDQGSYPSCLYGVSCRSVNKVALYWRVPDMKCWNVEPIIVTMCETEEPEAPDVNCKPPVDDSTVIPVGWSCRERYTNMQVWVYCSGKAGIQLMTIGVPTSCIAVKNKCLMTSD